MPRKIENVWSTVTSSPEEITGTSNVYTVASGQDDALIGTISIRISNEAFWTGPFGSAEAQPDEFLDTDRSHTYEMANEYYTGVIASGSETIVDNNITYRIVEDE